MAHRDIILPPDPDEMNDKRSEWAGRALQTFMRCTGVDRESAIRDLLADLAHYCDRRGLWLGDELAMAESHYEEETSLEGYQFERILVTGEERL